MPWSIRSSGALLAFLFFATVEPVHAGVLRVAATVPDLADLVREIGGDAVDVTSFARGGEDPHFVEARPSFIRVLSRANLLIYTGLDLELGWIPPLVRSARNSRIQPGKPGHFDASTVIPVLEIATGPIDRSQGDVHPRGNPHYLLDPVNGLRVAHRLRELLTQIAPDSAAHFTARYEDFERRLWLALVGPAWVEQHGAAALTAAALARELDALVASAHGDGAASGWLGTLAHLRGRPVVADHNLWPYFASRFGIRVAGFLEPVPGITPTSRHLTELAQRMKRDHLSVILSAAYFHPRYAQKLARASGAVVAEMANQVGAREGVDTYLEMTAWNVRELNRAFEQ